jgi:hypothetical protein
LILAYLKCIICHQLEFVTQMNEYSLLRVFVIEIYYHRLIMIYKLQTIAKPTYCELEEYIQGSTAKNGRDWYSHFTSETRSYWVDIFKAIIDGKFSTLIYQWVGILSKYIIILWWVILLQVVQSSGIFIALYTDMEKQICFTGIIDSYWYIQFVLYC